nr:deoxyribodipyrimidine photo-lyase [uncultured Dethiosulfovibrio sp.]
MIDNVMVNPDRVRVLKEGERGPGPIVYWMSRDQRVRDNWALLKAQELALEMKRALEVVFCLTEDFPGSSLRHHGFMLKGLEEVSKDLMDLNISFKVRIGDPGEQIVREVIDSEPGSIVIDFSPLKPHLKWVKELTSRCRWMVLQVDAHNVVPCWLASDKREYAARTIRPKLHRLMDRFIEPFPKLLRHPYGEANVDPVPPARELKLDMSLSPVALPPGSKAGERKLSSFISHKLEDYGENRNNPNLEGTSGLSPYFHFGQLAPQRAILAAQEADLPGTAPFVEESLIRRELSDNYCYHEREYDSYGSLPEWAKKALELHREDPRPWLYDLKALESGDTHDELWNAAQRSLADLGGVHGYLRMYWGKMILLWSKSPEEAFVNALKLNDRYALDGRDPNGYVGVGWCMGLHDRPWPRRPIFGTVRSMTLSGCSRKFDVKSFLKNRPSRA